MINKQNIPKLLLIFISLVIFTGCTTNLNKSGINNQEDSSSLVDKNREFTTTGVIKKSGDVYLIKSSNKTQDLDSYTIDFNDYLGKNVTVTGEYSGDTLFVTKIE